MLRGYVLRYLAAVVDGARPPEARALIPLLIRLLVERRARAHVIAIGFDTAHADDLAHVHRLAYLRAAKRPAHADEIDAVVAAYASGRSKGAEDRAFVRVAGFGAGLLVLACVSVGGWQLWSSLAVRTAVASDPSEPTLEQEQAAEAEVPEHPLRGFFARQLPAYTVALDASTRGRERAAPNDVATLRTRLLSTLTTEAPTLVDSMTGLLDAAEAYASDGTEAATDDGDGRWLNHLVAFHDALRDADVPFYLDATLTRNRRTGRRRILVSTFTVPDRRTFDVAGDSIQCLDIERLDTLNHERSLLGYTRPEVRYALVRVDRIERFLIQKVLPSVHAANESVIVRGYEDERGIEWVTDFENWAHEDLRAEHTALIAEALGGRAVGLSELAAAVVRRRNAVRLMSDSQRSAGLRLREPNAYEHDVQRIERLAPRLPGLQLRELRTAERELHSGPIRHAYRIMAEAFGLSIAEHEVQHRLDYEAGRLQQVPEMLSQYTGETLSEDHVNHRAERANAELSAYLSQVARRPSMARTSLVHVAGFVMARANWHKPEAYAALALFEALAAEHGIEHTRLIASRRIQRSQIALIYGVLRTLEPAALSALAGRAWTQLYGDALAPIQLSSED